MKADEFRKIAGDIKILDKTEEREMYSHDIGDVPPIMTKAFFKILPDFVVQPRNIDEIKKVLTFANEHKIPVVPRGAASWGFGGVIPTKAGIVIDLSPFRRILAIEYEALKRAHTMGVRIVLGTDTGSMPWDFSQAKEFEFLVKKAGFSPMEAIKAGTSVAAQLLDQSSQIGTLKPGMLADIVAVPDNPLEDITTLQRVVFVMKDGAIIRKDP